MHRGLLQAHSDSPGPILGESREEGVYFFFFLLASSSGMASYRQPPQPPAGGSALSLGSQPCELLVVEILPWGAQPPGLRDRQPLKYWDAGSQWSHRPLQSLAQLDWGGYILGRPWPPPTQSPRQEGRLAFAPNKEVLLH